MVLIVFTIEWIKIKIIIGEIDVISNNGPQEEQLRNNEAETFFQYDILYILATQIS